MKKKAFTLVELVITMTLSGILILVMTVQFIALARFNRTVDYSGGSAKETTLAVREARYVLNHMIRHLRFADPARTVLGPIGNNCRRIETYVTKGHNVFGGTPEDDYDTKIVYSLSIYSEGGEQKCDLGYTVWLRDGTSPKEWLTDKLVVDPVWEKNYFSIDYATNELSINLTFDDGRVTLPIKTKVKILGGS